MVYTERHVNAQGVELLSVTINLWNEMYSLQVSISTVWNVKRILLVWIKNWICYTMYLWVKYDDIFLNNLPVLLK